MLDQNLDNQQLPNTQIDSNDNQSFVAEEFFNKQWQIYQKVLIANSQNTIL